MNGTTQSYLHPIEKQSDQGNARRMVRYCRRLLRYVPEWKRWLVQEGTHWQQDDVNHTIAYQLAKTTVRTIVSEANAARSDSERISLLKWAAQSENYGRLKAMVALAATEQAFVVSPQQLDVDQYLLNVQNGTLDLRTGELYNHNPDDLITRCLPVSYEPDATCPNFLALLRRAMEGDDERVRFLQRALAYSLTGDISEQCLFFLLGKPSTGKTTILEIFLDLLGPYAQKASIDLLLQKPASSGPTPELVRLHGTRMVVLSETASMDERRRLNEALIKDLTGGDRIVARPLFCPPYEFVPTHKLWLYGNHRLDIRSGDDSIWRRIRLIPFEVPILPQERDRHFKQNKLLPELPGILAWAMQGHQLWQREGLGIPPAIRSATSAYRTHQDILGQFIEERYIFDTSKRTVTRDVFADFRLWCAETGEVPPLDISTQRGLTVRLQEAYPTLQLIRGTANRGVLVGIGRRPQVP